jgi:ferric-dicitrate binding protein FerR (iron transport regulator)
VNSSDEPLTEQTPLHQYLRELLHINATDATRGGIGALHAIKQRIAEVETKQGRPPVRDTGRSLANRSPRGASPRGRGLRPGAWLAVTCLVCALGILSFWKTPRERAPARRFNTAAGERMTIRLARGSTITLAPATSIAITQGGVELVGEALFSVVPEAHRPFIVRTANAETRVLGTTFVVRQHATDHATHVVVSDGRVSVMGNHARRDTTILSAGTLGVVSDSGVQVSPKINTADYMAWTTGTLVFRGTVARDVLAELGRAYDVRLVLSDSTLASQRLTMTVHTASRSITEVLDAVVVALGAHYTRAGRVMTIVPGRAANIRPHSRLQETQYGR